MIPVLNSAFSLFSRFETENRRFDRHPKRVAQRILIVETYEDAMIPYSTIICMTAQHNGFFGAGAGKQHAVLWLICLTW